MTETDRLEFLVGIATVPVEHPTRGGPWEQTAFVVADGRTGRHLAAFFVPLGERAGGFLDPVHPAQERAHDLAQRMNCELQEAGRVAAGQVDWIDPGATAASERARVERMDAIVERMDAETKPGGHTLRARMAVSHEQDGDSVHPVEWGVYDRHANCLASWTPDEVPDAASLETGQPRGYLQARAFVERLNAAA